MLQLYGFHPEVRLERRVLAPGAGFELRAAPIGAAKVYQRQYTKRRNNPTETVIDEKCQQFLNAAIPAQVERVHLTMRAGAIIGRPVPERTFHIRRAVRDPRTPLEAFVALSSGVDAACLSGLGFGMLGLLEYRPREKRDTRDLSETGVLTAVANNTFRYVFNEDIYRVDFSRLRETLKGEGPVALLEASPTCDDWSLAKAHSIKERHIASLETTVDMVYEVLRLVETLEPACIRIENVPAFGSSHAGELLSLKLRRWGYHVSEGIFDARHFGGLTGRKRYYLVASVFPGFEFPAATHAPQEGDVWRHVAEQIPMCRDATETSSVRDGIATGRIRIITPRSATAPTILKSQSRHTKDSIYIATDDGRYLFPNEPMLRTLQGIPDDFSLDAVSGEIAVEQIGQSVCWRMHHAIAAAIHRHLRVNRGESVESPIAPPAPVPVQPPPAALHEGRQGELHF